MDIKLVVFDFDRTLTKFDLGCTIDNKILRDHYFGGDYRINVILKTFKQLNYSKIKIVIATCSDKDIVIQTLTNIGLDTTNIDVYD